MGNRVQAFRIYAGIHGEVAHVNDRSNWRPYVTTKENTFDEPVRRTPAFVVFRSERWFLRVKVCDVMLHNGIRWVRMK